MSTINILVVEDDPVYALEAEMMIEELGYNLIDSVDNAKDALEAINSLRPDLIIMDINIKGLTNGIEIAEQIKDSNIPVIFFTVYNDENTYRQAKQTLPYAYIIKPFDKLTLQSTVEMALLRLGGQQVAKNVYQNWEEDIIVNENIFIKTGGKLIKINVNDIKLIQADGNYCMIFGTKRKHAVKISLTRIKFKISTHRFIQIHRNYIVQINHIDNVDLTNGEISVAGITLPIGGTYRESFMKKINLL